MMMLQADWTIADGELRVAYRLKNRHSVPAYAYTVPRMVPDLQLRPGSAYALVSESDLDLTLLLGSCDPPKDVSVPYRVQPLAVMVKPGKEFAGKVKLPIPVPEWGGYSNPDGPGDDVEPVDVYLLRFAVEYVLEGETYFLRPSVNGMWDVGGSPVRQLFVNHVPDRPVPVRRLPLIRPTT